METAQAAANAAGWQLAADIAGWQLAADVAPSSQPLVAENNRVLSVAAGHVITDPHGVQVGHRESAPPGHRLRGGETDGPAARRGRPSAASSGSDIL